MRRIQRANQRQTVFLILATLLAGLIGSACNGSTPPPPTSVPDPTEQQAPTDQPVSAPASPVPCDVDGVITVGISPDYPPFVDRGPAGVEGFDIDLMNGIAEAAGLQIEYVEGSDFGSLLTDLADGKFAVVISAISKTPEREEMVDFSAPYYQTVLAVAVREGSDIQTLDDLTGRRIGVQKSTTGADWCTQQFRDACASYQSIEEAFAALSEENVDAVIDDQSSAGRHIRAYEGLRLLDEFIPSQQEYGIAVRKDCGALLDAINAGLEEVRASGRYKRLCRAWEEKGEQAFEAGCIPEDATPTATPPLAGPTTTPPADVVPTPPPSCDIAGATGAGAGQPYEVQPGDWLSKIAEREYGNPFDYRAIVDLNNQKCRTNTAYTCIESPDRIAAGWIIYLPTSEEVDAYWGGQGLATLPEVDLTATGDIVIVGSQTVYPLTQRVADCFRETGFGGDIPDIGKEHTGPGFAKFCAKDADIADASRPITSEERQSCQDGGLSPIEFEIGTDAIVIAVSAGGAVGSDPRLADLTPEQVRQILATAGRWSEVDADWPDEPIRRFYPPEGSGTRDTLVQEIFGGDPAPLQEATNVTAQGEEYAEMAAQVRDDPYAVAFFGYAYYKPHADALRTLPVDGVEPRPETVDSGAYPLVRPLYIYSSADIMEDRPQVAAFINFYLRRVKYYITDVGYFLPDEQAFRETIERFPR